MATQPNVPSAALLAANDAFYDAFDSGDMDAMADVWAEVHQVACLHPGAAPIFGRDEVLASWRDILSASNRPAIQCLEPNSIVLDTTGLVICVEALAGGRLMASNAFVMENGLWRMVHHHAGPLSEATRPPQTLGGRLH